MQVIFIWHGSLHHAGYLHPTGFPSSCMQGPFILQGFLQHAGLHLTGFRVPFIMQVPFIWQGSLHHAGPSCYRLPSFYRVPFIIQGHHVTGFPFMMQDPSPKGFSSSCRSFISQSYFHHADYLHLTRFPSSCMQGPSFYKGSLHHAGSLHFTGFPSSCRFPSFYRVPFIMQGLHS